MNGIHDLGGMQGFGAVVREEHEPVFHADWERHVFAVLNLTIAAGQYHVDEIRHSIERMPPAEYLTTPYYEHWLYAAAPRYIILLSSALARARRRDYCQTAALHIPLPKWVIFATLSSRQ